MNIVLYASELVRIQCPVIDEGRGRAERYFPTVEVLPDEERSQGGSVILRATVYKLSVEVVTVGRAVVHHRMGNKTALLTGRRVDHPVYVTSPIMGTAPTLNS